MEGSSAEWVETQKGAGEEGSMLGFSLSLILIPFPLKFLLFPSPSSTRSYDVSRPYGRHILSIPTNPEHKLFPSGFLCAPPPFSLFLYFSGPALSD